MFMASLLLNSLAFLIQDVDGREKAGHDQDQFELYFSRALSPEAASIQGQTT
jgi:hypothetical protein